MSYLVLAPRGEVWATPPPGTLFRIVSEPLEGKGRRRFMACGPDGRVGLAMQEKHESESNRLFFKIARAVTSFGSPTPKNGVTAERSPRSRRSKWSRVLASRWSRRPWGRQQRYDHSDARRVQAPRARQGSSAETGCCGFYIEKHFRAAEPLASY